MLRSRPFYRALSLSVSIGLALYIGLQIPAAYAGADGFSSAEVPTSFDSPEFDRHIQTQEEIWDTLFGGGWSLETAQLELYDEVVEPGLYDGINSQDDEFEFHASQIRPVDIDALNLGEVEMDYVVQNEVTLAGVNGILTTDKGRLFVSGMVFSRYTQESGFESLLSVTTHKGGLPLITDSVAVLEGPPARSWAGNTSTPTHVTVEGDDQAPIQPETQPTNECQQRARAQFDRDLEDADDRLAACLAAVAAEWGEANRAARATEDAAVAAATAEHAAAVELVEENLTIEILAYDAILAAALLGCAATGPAYPACAAAAAATWAAAVASAVAQAENDIANLDQTLANAIDAARVACRNAYTAARKTAERKGKACLSNHEKTKQKLLERLLEDWEACPESYDR